VTKRLRRTGKRKDPRCRRPPSGEGGGSTALRESSERKSEREKGGEGKEILIVTLGSCKFLWDERDITCEPSREGTSRGE